MSKKGSMTEMYCLIKTYQNCIEELDNNPNLNEKDKALILKGINRVDYRILIEANHDLSEKKFDLVYKDKMIIYMQNVLIIDRKFHLLKLDKKFIVKDPQKSFLFYQAIKNRFSKNKINYKFSKNFKDIINTGKIKKD